MKLYFRRNYFVKVCRTIFFTVITFCVISYFPCNIYNFQQPQKFSGDSLYNPYKNLSAEWQKVNFHAHSVAWHGITNGKQPQREIINSYEQKGYSYASISNYEQIAKIDAQPNSVSVYEHGYNIFKTHQLVIMPQKVCYSDFPLFQFTSSKQYVINKLSTCSKAVVLAHPNLRNGYNDEDLKRISGYNLMEVLNHSGDASNKWDVALSAGKPVWIIGNDDTHNILDSADTFVNWTMINCAQHDKDSLISNLIHGSAYAVIGKNAFNDNELVHFSVDGMVLRMQLKNNADSIKLIGESGIVRETFYNKKAANYKFLDNDTYIRAVVYDKVSKMFLNPVIRYDGSSQPQNILTATVNFPLTILYRSSLIISWFILFVFLYRSAFKRLAELLRYNLQANRESSLVLETD